MFVFCYRKCGKPVKPKVTIQVASDTGQSKELVTPLPILAAFFHEDTSIMIAHGNNVLLTFENVVSIFIFLQKSRKHFY